MSNLIVHQQLNQVCFQNQSVSENASLIGRVGQAVQKMLIEIGQWLELIFVIDRCEECLNPLPPYNPTLPVSLDGPQPPAATPTYTPSLGMQKRRIHQMKRMGRQLPPRSSLVKIQNQQIQPMQSARSQATAPFFETYWESWNIADQSDYGSQLENIPVGNGDGKINVVSIAFGDYSFGKDNQGNITIGYLDGLMSAQELQQAVDKIHRNGGKVKLSLGGATFSMSTVVKSQADAETLAQNIAAVCKQDGLDGIDFDIEDAGTSADLQLYVYRRCRELLGPNALISYTFPAQGEMYEPYATVIKNGAQYFSAVNVMCYDYYWTGYNPLDEFARLESMGVPASKIVWGVMPGHADDPKEYVTVQNAIQIANCVKTNFGGLMMWTINRDTNHRTGCNGQDNVYETGQPDGTYVNAISTTLHA